jgi:hypothetical protein
MGTALGGCERSVRRAYTVEDLHRPLQHCSSAEFNSAASAVLAEPWNPADNLTRRALSHIELSLRQVEAFVVGFARITAMVR